MIDRWLDELDTALLAADDAAAPRVDALVASGLRLLDGPAAADGSFEPAVLGRVIERLRAAADQVAADLDAVRGERQALARVGRAHAGYAAVGP